jgi:hypothetical protein
VDGPYDPDFIATAPALCGGLRAKLILGLRRYIPGELFERLLFGYIRRRVTAPRQQSKDVS